MAKLNNFIVTSIKAKNENELIVNISVNGIPESFVVNTTIKGTFSFPDKLEILLMSKEFNQSREFIGLLSDYLAGSTVQMPFVVIGKTVTSQQLQIA